MGFLPAAALAAAVVVIAVLVLIVRKIRRAEDLQTTVLAVLVGLVVTVSPAALLLLNRVDPRRGLDRVRVAADRDVGVRAGLDARLRRRRGDGLGRPDQPGPGRAETSARQSGVPVLAVHAPCLLITQRVWSPSPEVRLRRSVEAAQELDAQPW